MPSDVVNSFIGAVERNDLEHALTHLTEDCEYDNVPMGVVHGRDAVRATLAPFLARYDEVQWVIVAQAESGNLDDGLVLNERIDRFRNGEQWVELPVAGVFRIRHGQIALWRDYFDRDMLTRAMAGPA